MIGFKRYGLVMLRTPRTGATLPVLPGENIPFWQQTMRLFASPAPAIILDGWRTSVTGADSDSLQESTAVADLERSCPLHPKRRARILPQKRCKLRRSDRKSIYANWGAEVFIRRTPRLHRLLTFMSRCRINRAILWRWCACWTSLVRRRRLQLPVEGTSGSSLEAHCP